MSGRSQREELREAEARLQNLELEKMVGWAGGQPVGVRGITYWQGFTVGRLPRSGLVQRLSGPAALRVRCGRCVLRLT